MSMFQRRQLLSVMAMSAIFFASISGCQLNSIEDETSHPVYEIMETGTAELIVEAAVAGVFSNTEFSYTITDFSETRRMESRDIRSGDSVFSAEADQGFSFPDPSIYTVKSPNSLTTLGSLPYAVLEEFGTVSFDSPRRLLGFHISLSREQVIELEDLEPEQGSGSSMDLPQFNVLVSGFNRDGMLVDSIRAIPAIATYAESNVALDWFWVDTSLLREIASFSIKVESPIEGLSYILVDNLTTSADFVPDEDFFTIALIPDTQKYSESPDLRALFDAQTTYLADSADTEHIAFASHLGDIVENGEIEAEWQVADAAMRVLDGLLPYGIVPGNHDYVDEWNHPEKGSPYFLSYFPESRFESYSWWVGVSPDRLSSAQIFDTPLGRFLYFHLSVDSPPPTVEWAQGIIDANPGIPTLVTTHAYLRENGRIPVPYLSAMAQGTWEGISADELFTSLIAPNDQIFMVTCGHISAEYHQVSANRSGLGVFEVLQDYQNRKDGGEGFLRLMRFFPGRDIVQMVTYSPWLHTYEIDDDSYFTLSIDFDARF
ncbi:MAG TPA: hypothetical protein DIT55_07165 [Spirochaetaceae bacterium]|nr:hypothetical protein [Spirochaetaceae bacterium]